MPACSHGLDIPPTGPSEFGLVDVDYLDLWYGVSSSLGKFGEPRSYSADTIMAQSMRYASVQYPLLPPCVHGTWYSTACRTNLEVVYQTCSHCCR
jgi:hypothetical protein